MEYECMCVTVQCMYHCKVCHPQFLGFGTKVYRLRGGPLPWTGRVEVRKAGNWTTICDDSWGVTEASLVCRALGYGTAKSVHKRAHFGRGSGEVGYAGLK